jgi:hypothetical protein
MLDELTPLLTGIDKLKTASVVRQAGGSKAVVEVLGYLVDIEYQQTQDTQSALAAPRWRRRPFLRRRRWFSIPPG